MGTTVFFSKLGPCNSGSFRFERDRVRTKWWIVLMDDMAAAMPESFGKDLIIPGD